MSSKSKYAFPQLGNNGMTLRDYFAAKAMPAIYRDFWDGYRAGLNGNVAEDWKIGLAMSAYEMADAMLIARTAREVE
jgi:hypothetical protein